MSGWVKEHLMFRIFTWNSLRASSLLGGPQMKRLRPYKTNKKLVNLYRPAEFHDFSATMKQIFIDVLKLAFSSMVGQTQKTEQLFKLWASLPLLRSIGERLIWAFWVLILFLLFTFFLRPQNPTRQISSQRLLQGNWILLFTLNHSPKFYKPKTKTKKFY